MKPRKPLVDCVVCGMKVIDINRHKEICNSVLIRKYQVATTDSPLKEDSSSERICPRCEKVLIGDKDFEMHLAVTHKFFWWFEFTNEDEFKKWFKAEGFDETMYRIDRRPTITHPSLIYKKSKFTRSTFYSCVINGKSFRKRKKKDPKTLCPCQLSVGIKGETVCVEYFVLHNHTQRFVRQGITDDCREMIANMLNNGVEILQVFKAVKEAYPPTSVNYLIQPSNIVRLRKYLRQRRRLSHQQDSSEISAQLEEIPHSDVAEASTAGTGEAKEAFFDTETSGLKEEDSQDDSFEYLP